MNNVIEVMLEPIRQAITGMEIDTLNSDVLDLCYKSISAGEAELVREPVATVCRSFGRITPQSDSYQIDKRLPVGTELFTRGEIK
jgi:hypothetical protein